MPPKIDPIQLLQARSRLREQLPVLPGRPGKQIDFNHIALEGYLFAILVSPLEIGPDIWGFELDGYLPDACYDDENHYDDIFFLYENMEDAVEQGQTFRVHSLNLPASIPTGEIEGHPLDHWVKGFAEGHRVVLSELDRMANRKKHRKNPEIHDIVQEYKTHIVLFYGGLKWRMNPDAPTGAEPTLSEMQQHVFSHTLPNFFNQTLEGMCLGAKIAAIRLEEEL